MKNKGKLYELIINPKMSFGTGHHPTTHMMMEFVLEETLVDKTILRYGLWNWRFRYLGFKERCSK